MILVLQTSTFGAYGGIPSYNRLVCRALNELGWAGEINVLLATDEQAHVEARRGRLGDLNFEAFACDRLAFVRRALSLAASRRIDLALVGHVNYAPLGWWFRRMQPRMRYGVMMYGVDVWGKLSRPRRLGLRRADFSVSISEYTRRKAVEANGALEGPVHLLPNALDCEEQGAVGASPPTPGGKLLLTVCRLDADERYKGVDLVIKSLPAVLARVPDARYAVVGSGSDAPRLKKLAEDTGVAGRVHFLGSVDDAALRAYYRECDVFVMPSEREGFGFVFLEAMQYAKPVVAADSGGSPEVVTDGETGLMVKYGDVPGLAESLARLCLDPALCRRLGRAGYERLHERFTYPRFKQTLTEIVARELPPGAAYRARRFALTS